jgi:hypothetical protein
VTTVAGSDRSPLTASSMDADNNEFATPPRIWRPLSRAVDGFDVDPASGAEPTPIAPTRFTKADDGLVHAWHGWVFLNPPWSSNGDGAAKERWLRKARNEAERDAVDGIVMVLPVDTSAHWFHDHVLAASAICFVGPGRISFIGEDRNPSFGLLIAVYGASPDRLVEALDDLGAVMVGRCLHSSTEQLRLGSQPGGGE